MIDYSIVFVDVDNIAAIKPKLAAMVYIYKKADWQAMREGTKNVRLQKSNTQQQWDKFEDKLHKMINDHVPS